MLFKELGKSGTTIAEVGIGTWEYRGGPEPIRRGLEAGALFIDTAESYGSEPVVAEAIAGRRRDVFLASKVSPQNFRRADLLKAIDGSLQRLRTDHLDLYQLHKPNDSIPIEETMAAMEETVDAGKVRYIGVSNFSVAQLQRAQKALRKQRIVSNQVRFNIIDRTICGDILPYCEANQVTVIAYSPLARGFQHVRDCDKKNALEHLAAATGRTPVQIALNWCLGFPNVVVIPKGNSVEHVLENVGATDWRLSPEQLSELNSSIVAHRRSALEQFLRRHMPQGGKEAIQRLLKLSPRALRQRIH